MFRSNEYAGKWSASSLCDAIAHTLARKEAAATETQRGVAKDDGRTTPSKGSGPPVGARGSLARRSGRASGAWPRPASARCAATRRAPVIPHLSHLRTSHARPTTPAPLPDGGEDLLPPGLAQHLRIAQPGRDRAGLDARPDDGHADRERPCPGAPADLVQPGHPSCPSRRSRRSSRSAGDRHGRRPRWRPHVDGGCEAKGGTHLDPNAVRSPARPLGRRSTCALIRGRGSGDSRWPRPRLMGTASAASDGSVLGDLLPRRRSPGAQCARASGGTEGVRPSQPSARFRCIRRWGSPTRSAS